MISRIWHGWATSGNADSYETLLIFPVQQTLDRRHGGDGDGYDTG